MIRPDELIVDSFAGGGGASLGIEMALGRSPDIAINHDAEALAMHAANHPATRHFCESVWDVEPLEATGGKPVGLAWFSPDCTFHSKARGGKPFRDRDKARRRRGLAWVVIRWAKAVAPRVIILENVEEFADWGPLLPDGKPDPLRRGFTFRRWLAQLRNSGYQVEMRELRACDFGAPTTRKRLFIIARRDGLPIVWPAPTHGPGRALAYRTAADCIDWAIACPSIFERAKPLAENTLKRIARGLKRYVLEAAEPFVVPLTHHGDRRVHPAGEPLPTITGAHRGELALVEPYLVRTAHGEADANGKKRGRGEHALADPLPTVLASNDFALAAPYLARIAQQNGNGKYTNGVDEPLTTITTKAEHLVVAPSLVQVGYGEREGQAPRCLDPLAPLGTIVAQGNKFALCSAFLAKHYGDTGQRPGSAMGEPMDTITACDHHSLVTTHLVKLRGGLDDHPNPAQDLRAPAPTLTAGGTHLAEVRAFLLKYNGQEGDPRLMEPLHTVTTVDRFGLVTVQGVDYAIVDIGMRMLAPRELFRAQGFHDGYRIEVEHAGKVLSKTSQVRMCGNSVAPQVAAALVEANVGHGRASAGGPGAPGVQLNFLDALA